jgi:hypothetical protein
MRSSLTDVLPLQKKEQKDAENAEGQAAGGKKKKVTAAQLRVQKGTRSNSQAYTLAVSSIRCADNLRPLKIYRNSRSAQQ